MSEEKIICNVCFRHCCLSEGETGFCRVRKNEGGENVPVNYGLLTSLALDPIEKKPLARFMSGSMILSVGSFGCNMRCPYCQNYEISQASLAESKVISMSPEELVSAAERERPNGNIGIAFTYNEPSISFEFVRDTARLVKEAGMKTVLVTNGCVSLEVLREFLPWIDAMNVDLKGFTEDYYKWTGGDLSMVKAFIEESVKKGVHVEVTELILSGHNDSEEETEALAAYLAGLSSSIVLHITRSFPRWKELSFDPPSASTILKLCLAAMKHLKYVVPGNI
ncbi:MAG: AmmeMemoRadiSam system radical SAM enzyme [Lachnospiraceae bacterium]|nr:AmmeMemoRadiSam system radical SAM enzyme [Lachnospiraceae bacterium]